MNKRQTKKVTFSDALVTVFTLHTWLFAYKQARKGEYKELVSDRMRFNRRIHQANVIIGPVLKNKLNLFTYKKMHTSQSSVIQNSDVKQTTCMLSTKSFING